MARSEIILGTPPQGLGGDPPRVASMKINAMTDELYRLMGGKVDLAAVTNADVGSLYNTAGWFLSPTGNPNNPPLAFPFGILHCPSQTSHAFQIASPVTSVAANRNRLWIRQRAGTTWSPWSEILTGAGTAATLDAQVNVDDETVGRLQLVGSMGWGSINRTPVTSLNDFTASQKFNINADVPGNPRQLSGLQFAAGSCGIAMCWTAAHQQQLVFSRTTGQIVYRYKNANVWQPDQHLVLFPAGQTFLSVAQGGNGNANGISDQAQTAINGKASINAQGVNTDIRSLTGLTTALPVNQGGNGTTTGISAQAQAALNTKFDATNAILDPQNAGGLMSSTVVSGFTIEKFLNGVLRVSGAGGSATWPANNLSPSYLTIPNAGFIALSSATVVVSATPSSTFDTYGVISAYLNAQQSITYVNRNGPVAQTFEIRVEITGRWKA